VLAAVLACIMVLGCATSTPYTGRGPHSQLERGAAFPPVDVIGNILSLPYKLLLWSWKFNSHVISPDTEREVVEYLDARNLEALHDTRFRLNQYHPIQDLSRLARNHHVAWPYRLLVGLPLTLLMDVALPGRLFPWGDYYNPYTNTVHLYSDDPAIALHEAGHAHDFATRRFKGTYGMIRLVPFVSLAQEWVATDEAIQYLQETNDRDGELHAYKILYPAYGSYIGGYIYAPIGTVAGVLVGHAIGRRKAADRAEYFERFEGAGTEK